jgi:dipeptidyl aminopeptidase/acylaminoacyl peptidase
MNKMLPLLCIGMAGLIAAPIFPAPDKDFVGTWQGAVEVQGTKLRLAFHIKKGEDGGYTATWDSLDQGATDLPMDSVTVDGDQIVMVYKGAGVEVVAVLQPDGDHMQATLNQGGMELPLELERTDKVEKPKRPQEPKKPYPYLEEEVSYENQAGGITIAGTLTYPTGDGPFPAVLLITGSGAQDRNETVMGHKPFLVLSDYLTRRGIAVLRCDDRGVGGTTGSLAESTTADLAEDVLTGVAFLKAHDKIDPAKIGLVGHSEGGLIAPLAASHSDDLAFIVMMAGTGLTGEEILYLQGALIARAEGVSEEKIQESRKDQERIYAVLKSGESVEEMEKTLRRMYKEDIAKMGEEERKESEITEAELDAQLKQVLSDWFRYFLTYDPRHALQKVRCPVLALNGEKDLQVPPKENLAEIGKALKKAGNKDVTLKEFEGLNHLFQTAETGAVSEYSKIEETISPAVLEYINEWIQGQIKRK